MTRLILADDHKIVLDGIAAIVEGIEDFEVVALAIDGVEAVKFARSLDPDIVLMDVDMPVMNGIDALKEITSDQPDISVCMLSMHLEKAMIQRCLEFGAKGYLYKAIDAEELAFALRKILSGEIYVSGQAAFSLAKQKNFGAHDSKLPLRVLTSRELEILAKIVHGLSSKEIAQELFISVRTVEKHRSNMMQKLEVKSMGALIRVAMKSGLVGSD